MAETTIAPVEGAIALMCPECGYDLRGISSEQCPECGQKIDRASMSVSRIPWTHRQAIGRFRAYRRTNLLVIFRPRRLAEEVARPVSFADAQSFRHITVWLAALPILPALLVTLIVNWDAAFSGIHRPAARLGWFLEAGCFLLLALAIWLALLMISGIGSYFFHPRSLPVALQNRAIALSYYTCAPLAWLWLPTALFGIACAIASQEWGQYGVGDELALVTALTGAGLLLLILLTCWMRTTGLMRKLTHCGPGWATVMALYLPFAWALCVALALSLPAALLYVSLVVLSFR